MDGSNDQSVIKRNVDYLTSSILNSAYGIVQSAYTEKVVFQRFIFKAYFLSAYGPPPSMYAIRYYYFFCLFVYNVCSKQSYILISDTENDLYVHVNCLRKTPIQNRLLSSPGTKIPSIYYVIHEVVKAIDLASYASLNVIDS